MLESTSSQPALRTRPPIRSGSTVGAASTRLPDACSICFTIAAASSSVSSYAVVSSTLRICSSAATSASYSRAISSSCAARPFSVTTRTKLRISSSAPSRTASSTAAFVGGSSSGFRISDLSSGTSSTASTNVASSSRTGSMRPSSFAASKSARAYVRATTATLVRAPLLEGREVELADRFVDQPLVVVGGEHLARHLLGRDHGQVGDLGADRLQRARRLGLDLARGLLEPALAVLLELVAQASLLRLGDLPRLCEDLFGLTAGLGHRRTVLLDELLRLGAGPVGLVERLANPLAALVDHLLDPAEGELLQHVVG